MTPFRPLGETRLANAFKTGPKGWIISQWMPCWLTSRLISNETGANVDRYYATNRRSRCARHTKSVSLNAAPIQQTAKSTQPDYPVPVDDGPAAIDAIEVVDIAAIPGGGELHLLKCGDEFSIQFDRDELMGSRDHISEMALATLTRQRLSGNDDHVLVGGLGMGFTLGAVLEAWSFTTSVMVAELVPQIVGWAKGPLAHLFGSALSDPRVCLRVIDVHDAIAEEPNRFDAILLDVDNGPDGFITPANDRLYSHAGLRLAYAALRDGGILAVWSSYRDDHFSASLENTGFSVDEVRVPAYSGSVNHWHYIWLATKPTRG